MFNANKIRNITIIGLICGCIIIIGEIYILKNDVQKETSIVDVKIVNEYHRDSYISPVFSGKTVTMVTHPAIYQITVKYDGDEYIVSDRDTYYKYRNKVGKQVKATLKTSIYNSVVINSEITKLE